MSAARLPENEAERLNALRGLDILDTGTQQGFDDLTLIASTICSAPIGLVSFVDQDRQWFKSKRGLTVSQTPREQAFCAHAILAPDEILEVPDATQDERFRDNPLVTGDPHIRFYAGAPLVTDDGYAIGTLCVIDRVPRRLDPRQLEALRALSRQAVAQLNLHDAHRQLRRAFEESRQYQRELEEYQSRLEHLNSQLQQQAVTDPLTGLYNRLAFGQHLNQAVAHAGRYGESLSLLIVDVDLFKALNDSFGHVAGDEALQSLARILRESSREADVVARYGGEEFAIILPATGLDGARALAERARRQVETASWTHRPLTISVGGVTRSASHPRREAKSLVAEADAALYRAKTGGRNQVCIYSETESFRGL